MARFAKFWVASGAAVASAVLALVSQLVTNGVLSSMWWQVAIAVIGAAGVRQIPNVTEGKTTDSSGLTATAGQPQPRATDG